MHIWKQPWPKASQPKGSGTGEGCSKSWELCACQLPGDWLAMLSPRQAKLVSKQATKSILGPSGGGTNIRLQPLCPMSPTYALHPRGVPNFITSLSRSPSSPQGSPP